jgi:hypothetical protein
LQHLSEATPVKVVAAQHPFATASASQAFQQFISHPFGEPLLYFRVLLAFAVLALPGVGYGATCAAPRLQLRAED